jgi:hypothetical protein
LGERAMALAMLYPEPEKTAPGKKTKVSTLSDYKSVGATRLSQARAVNRFSPELAVSVRDGTIKLDAALEQVKAGQQMVQSEQDRAKPPGKQNPGSLADAPPQQQPEQDHMVTRLRAEAP